MAKIYSKLLVEEEEEDNQYGFQKGKSTVDCIFILHALIIKKH